MSHEVESMMEIPQLHLPRTPVKRRLSPTGIFSSPPDCSLSLPRTGCDSSMSKRRKDGMESPLSCTPKKLKFLNNDAADRFIPCRSSMDMQTSSYHLMKDLERCKSLPNGSSPPSSQASTPLKPEFQRTLKDTLLSSPTGSQNSSAKKEDRVLSFHERPYRQQDLIIQHPLKLFNPEPGLETRRIAKPNRHIPSTPSRILDAPDLVDDYYLNLISWGNRNILAVALGPSVYLWNAKTCETEHLLTLDGPDDYVTSVQFMDQDSGPNHIAVGTNSSVVQLWDAATITMVRSMSGHTSRVGALSWNGDVISSGGRDAIIINHDTRATNHRISQLTGHQQEICGLRWSPDGTTLASGGNENFLCLWDGAMEGGGPRAILTDHVAAVKALAWCPFQRRLLASGGGTADRTIKFWNSGTASLLNSIDTGSQVCALLWSKHQKEIVSSHGFSENQLCLWKYPSMMKIREFKGHTSRVLHLDQSPDGITVVSAAADETLRFWDIMGPPIVDKKRNGGIGNFTVRNSTGAATALNMGIIR